MKKGLLLIVAAVLSHAANAREGAGTQWSLDDCISYAIENNLQIKQKRLATEISKVDCRGQEGCAAAHRIRLYRPEHVMASMV